MASTRRSDGEGSIYFDEAKRVLSGVEGPKRNAVLSTVADEEVSAVAAANATRWRDTLAILSR